MQPPLYLDPDTYAGRYTADQMRDYATAAVLAEREACAKVCEDFAYKWMQLAASCGGDDAHEVVRSNMADEIADAIRARKELP